MTTDPLIKIVTDILVNMEEARLCNDCMADDCQKHEVMPDPVIGCADGTEIAQHLRAAGVTAPAQPAEDPLREAALAVVEEGPLGEVPCCWSFCKCSAHQALRAALEAKP